MAVQTMCQSKMSARLTTICLFFHLRCIVITHGRPDHVLVEDVGPSDHYMSFFHLRCIVITHGRPDHVSVEDVGLSDHCLSFLSSALYCDHPWPSRPCVSRRCRPA